MYDGAEWYPLANGGLNNLVRTLTIFDNKLWVGGDFNSTYNSATTDLNLNLMAEYDPINSKWNGLTNKGLFIVSGSTVETISAIDNKLYVGGLNIHKTGDSHLTNFNNIVVYDPNKALNIYSIDNVVSTLGLYGDSVKVFFYDSKWNLVL
jgi:hypothetical protein